MANDPIVVTLSIIGAVTDCYSTFIRLLIDKRTKVKLELITPGTGDYANNRLIQIAFINYGNAPVLVSDCGIELPDNEKITLGSNDQKLAFGEKAVCSIRGVEFMKYFEAPPPSNLISIQLYCRD